jgi:thioredoxin reductase
MSDETDVAIIGAGPNGLSIAAHLASRGVSFRIFGKPMESWLDQMPKGMSLKSEGFASSLYDPGGRLSLGKYCAEKKLPYADMGNPVAIETFREYGLAFQRLAVPMLEKKKVTSLRKSARGFTLELDSGETLSARRVVMAVGITHFAHLPDVFAGLPPELVSHSSAHTDVAPFAGRDVTVLGAGSSAIDIAALLHEAGAKVRIVARRPVIEIHSKMRLPRPLSDRLREPMTGIGPSWRSWFFTNMPTVFHRMPEARRLKWVKNHLGPSGAWFMADRVVDRFPMLPGRTPVSVKAAGGKVKLELAAGDGTRETIETDHVIAATGYQPRLDRLTFIDPALAAAVTTVQQTPILSSQFQSSVPGLYFVGLMSANSFGPLMRFAVGAKFTAPYLSRHLAAGATRVRADQSASAPGMAPEPERGGVQGGLPSTVSPG